MLCKISKSSGKIWYACFFLYGAPIVEERHILWNLLLSILDHLPNCVILGHFNLVELFEDNKLGGSNTIRGWDSFMDWRFASNLLSAPFMGPRFT